MNDIKFLIGFINALAIIVPFFIIVCAIPSIIKKQSKISKIIKNGNNINEFSFQRYAKFYGDTVLFDNEFNYKINKIYDLIIIKNIQISKK